MTGTATIEAQVYPFEFYSLMTDGVIESTASYPVRELIKCTEAGILAIPEDAIAGTVFAFARAHSAMTRSAVHIRRTVSQHPMHPTLLSVKSMR